MTLKEKTDLLIIGAGPGGYVAAIYAAKKGLKVTLIDKNYIGGTCLNIGCIPTKALVKSADIYEEIMHSDLYGIISNHPSIDMVKVLQRKDEVTKTLVDGISFLLNKYQVNVIKGEASFENNSLVKIHTETIDYLYEATDILIATGAKTKHLKVDGIQLEQVYDSEKLLSNQKLPETLTIIGGGIIGMEFAFIYGHLGVKVNVIEFLPSILPMVDKDLSQRLLRFAKMANISIYTNSGVQKIEQLNKDYVRVYYKQKEEIKFVDSNLILEAVGRIPNYESLSLEKTDILIGKTYGIDVNESMQTSVKHIYAIGDVTNKMQLAHVASHQGIIAIDTILGHKATMDYSFVPSVIFTTPQIALVGKTETELIKEEIEYFITKVPFSANGKALIMNNSIGFIKLIQDKESKLLIGASIFGGDAEHLISPLTLAMQNKLSVVQIKDTIFAHPTTSELIHEAALGLLGEAIHYLD